MSPEQVVVFYRLVGKEGILGQQTEDQVNEWLKINSKRIDITQRLQSGVGAETTISIWYRPKEL